MVCNLITKIPNIKMNKHTKQSKEYGKKMPFLWHPMKKAC